MKIHAEKCVECFCELAHKSEEQSSNGSAPCMDDHQCTANVFEIVGEIADVRAQIVLKCTYLARVGRCRHLMDSQCMSLSLSGHNMEQSVWQKGWRD